MRARSVFAISVALLLAGLAAPRVQAPSRVILVSWDGAAYWMASRLLSEGKLPNLARLVREGNWSDGMISSFPTKTAAAHAMLWTGTYGHTNGITGNSVLLEPASEHSRLESRSGYFSDALKAEPLWVTTARAGLKTYVFHATQSYPFEKHLQRLSPTAAREKLQMLYGYTRINVPAEVFSEQKTPTAPAWGWAIPEARGAEAREFGFDVGEDRFWAVLFDDPIDPAKGCDTLGIARDKQATAFEARVKPGEKAAFSIPVGTRLQDKILWFSLRLFELDPIASRFLIYRTSAQAVVTTSEDFPGAGELSLETFDGNGASSLYRTGDLGISLPDGGAGGAEDRFLETLDHLTEQIKKQAEHVLKRGDYRLLVLYSPVLDEVAHAFAGYLDPATPGYEETLAAKLWPKMTQAFESQDRFLGWLMDYAAQDGSQILLVSDHGMAGTSRLLNVNIALERAGLLSLTPERAIDLSRTRALLLPLSDASVAVNTMDRKGGIVPMEGKRSVLKEVQKSLDGVEDPATGKRVVKDFFYPSINGLLQPGGATTGDLFLDLVPGYYFSSSTERDELVTKIAPEGNHIFLPTRRAMLAICGTWGPRVSEVRRWPRVRAIDIVPTVLDLLHLESSPDLPGRSLLPRAPLIQPMAVYFMSGYGHKVSDSGHYCRFGFNQGRITSLISMN